MIYTRWSAPEPVRLIGYLGWHRPSYLSESAQLVRVLHVHRDQSPHTLPIQEEQYQWAQTLRADGGWDEIETAIANAPLVMVSPRVLRAAFDEAK